MRHRRPRPYADNLSILSDGEDSDPGVPSDVVSGSSLVRDANTNADARSDGYVPMGLTYESSEGVASKAVGYCLLDLDTIFSLFSKQQG